MDENSKLTNRLTILSVTKKSKTDKCYEKGGIGRKRKLISRCTKLLVFGIFLNFNCFSQINFTANTSVKAYNAPYYFGINPGYYKGWTDSNIAEIAAGNPAKNVPGAGFKSLRPALPEDFLEKWGYDIRINEFKFYHSLGIRDNTVFIGTPTAAHKDTKTYDGCTSTSKLFANMYTNIWDGGANGTPVNDSNYYALYVWKLVTRYKGYIKFYEVLNEPDYSQSNNGWKASGVTGNWFDQNPKPCELNNLRAPIFHYIRLLRISYEVIKSVDPDAYVAIGGIGYESFLDAVLRNTDNPSNGAASSTYPNKGGAYFDVVSYHVYPHINGTLRYWANGGWVNKRHSDAAVGSFFSMKTAFQARLAKHGYNGSTYPQKHFIVTETNVPRKAFAEYFGGDTQQKNYVLKTSILAHKNGIKQIYYFAMGEGETYSLATSAYQVMGFYNKLVGVAPFKQVITNSGIAIKTASDLLTGFMFDNTKTKQLALPATIDGAAFYNSSTKKTIYALWAKTTTDRSETVSAKYSFPTSLNIAKFEKREWNNSKTKVTSTVSPLNVALTGSPIFLTAVYKTTTSAASSSNEAQIVDNLDMTYKVSNYPNPVFESTTFNFKLPEDSQVWLRIFNENGQVVANLLQDQFLSQGNHEVEFKRTDLPTGIYIYTLESSLGKISGKMLIQ